jgi:hypothetical protein
VAPRALIAVLVAGLVAGCGSSSEGNRKSANQCLSKLGLFVDHGLPAHLFIPAQVPGLSYHATGLAQVAEVSYPATNAGANSVTAYYFESENDARGAESDLDGPGTNYWGKIHPTRRVGKVVLIWSSEPTSTQETSVLACFDGG